VTSRDFLRRVLADAGYHFAVIKGHKGFKHLPANSHANLLMIIKEQVTLNRDVWFSMASYRRASYVGSDRKVHWRTTENALWVKSFWLDLDVGRGKDFASQGDATRALMKFCRKAKLTLPMIVSSGSGLHCYWPLTAAITVPDWQATARKLKELTQYHGFSVDGTRTADVTSVLRPIGTRNYKFGGHGLPVFVIRPGTPMDFPDFHGRIIAAHRLIPQVPRRAQAAPAQRKGPPLNKVNVALIQSMLAALPASYAVDHDPWIYTGFSLHDFDSGDVGLALWRWFSKRCPEKAAQVNFGNRWASMGGGTPKRRLTWKWLVNEAERHGWRAPRVWEF